MIILIIVFAICLAWLMNVKKLKITSLPSPPTIKGSLPLLGHSRILPRNCTEMWIFIKRASRRSLAAGGVLKFNIGIKPYYLITDPDDSLTIANTCLNKHFSYNFAKRWLGSGLITSSGNTWKRHRKLLSPAFSLQVLFGFMDIFNAQSRKLLAKVDTHVGTGPFDVSIHLRQMALENIFLTALGISLEENAALLKSYSNAVDTILIIIMKRFLSVWLHSDFLYSFTKLKRKEDDVLRVVNGMADVVIKQKRAALMQKKPGASDATISGYKCKALLDLLLELSDEDALNDREINEELNTVVTAALDTSAWTITYTLVLLGTHQEVQDKVVRELEQVFGKEDRDVTKSDLPSLVYMEAVIKESLRLYSFAPITLRTLEKDTKLKNYTLRSGDHCIISSYGIHRHECWGPDREVFRPERWMEPQTQGLVFAGFSLGRRTCIGKPYAMMMVKTVLSHLLRRYKFTANVKDLKLKLEFILKPASGHLVRVERRN